METELLKLSLAFRGLSDDPDGEAADNIDLDDEELDDDDDLGDEDDDEGAKDKEEEEDNGAMEE